VSGNPQNFGKRDSKLARGKRGPIRGGRKRLLLKETAPREKESVWFGEHYKKLKDSPL